MANPAVAVIARWEWARRWRSLLMLGIVGGLLGGIVVGGAVLARRTISAPDRLHRAVAPGDLHLQVFDPTVADEVVRLPEVASAWVAGIAVGRIENGEGLNYAGLVAPTSNQPDLVRPVVVEGRAADPADPSEVVVTEAIGLEPGDHLELAMLSAEEVFQFDTGFGEPDGPTVDLSVVGVVRVPPGVFDGSPVMATPAFAAAHGDLFAGYDLRLLLHGGSAAADQVVREANALASAGGEPTGQDFAPVAADVPRDGTDRLVRAAHVLFAGLVAAVALAGLAVAAGLAQAWSRHHGATAAAQRIESALGLTSPDRVAARLLPALAPALVAGVIAAAAGVAASWVQPVGNLWRSEPVLGHRLDLTAVVVGGAAMAALTMLTAAFTAWRAGRTGAAERVSAVGRRLRLVPARGGWPLAGASFALSRGGTRHVPVRMSLVGCVVGIAGVVGALTFTASLDRLVDTPSRWGWNADLLIADADSGVLDELRADPRIASVADVSSASATIDGRSVDGYAVQPLVGDAGWVLQHGRFPGADDEVVLGGRLAHELDLRIGDTVSSGERELTVVGIGLGPASNLEPLGSSALFSDEGLAALASTGRFREALVRVRPDVDLDAVVADYSRYELTVGVVPTEVRDVSELGSLPALLGGFLALLAAIALVHALVVTGAGRARDLAVLRALGASPRHAGMTVVAMSITSVAVGLLGGVPLGLALARLLWGEVARSIGVGADVELPWTLPLVVVGAVLSAALLAIVPAVRAARESPSAALRAD